MLRFFRQFRLKYIEGKSFRKYLLYSIGEIILVVLGILIALQINNWNDANKNRTLEHEILKELKTELINNKNQLDQIIKDRAISLDICRTLLPSFVQRRNLVDIQSANLILEKRPANRVIFASARSNQIDSLIGSLPSYGMFYPRMGNIKSIIYSGKLNLISDPQIKVCIAEFEDRTKSVEVAIAGADKIMNEQIQPILRAYLKDNGSYPLDEFFQDIDLRFFDSNYLGWTAATLNTSTSFSETMELTINAIEEKLVPGDD